MKKIELFVQGEGIKDIILITVDAIGSARNILMAIKAAGYSLENEEQAVVFLEDEDNPIDLDRQIHEVGVQHHNNLHIHSCRQVEVSVNFNGESKMKEFPPSATIKRVKGWATGPHGFNMSKLDASEHALQLCNTSVRPDEDTHIGALISHTNCCVSFDLVPKIRVEG